MSDVNKLILAEGDEARRNNEKKTNSRKVRFLKGGQSFRGRFITTKFQQFAQHSRFVSKGSPKNIQSHACIKQFGRCPSCEAGVEVSKKTLVYWFDIDANEIVVRDMSKGPMATIYAAVDQYGDDLTKDTFTISMGDKGAVSVMYLKPKAGEAFAPTPDDVAIDVDLLAYVMNVKTEKEVEEIIAGKVETAAKGDVTIKPVDGHEKF